MPRIRGSCLHRLRSMSTITILAYLIVFVFITAMWNENCIENEILQTPSHSHYNNEIMAKAGQNYPVCSNIDALEQALIIEEKNRVREEKRYDQMLLRGQMNCGNIRVGLGVFRKRSNIPWITCAPLILSAKRRLLGYIKELCSSQNEANDRYARNDNSREQSKSSTVSASITPSYFPERAKQRGVVYTGKAEHFHDIYQSIYSIRLLNVSLPVEIWVNNRDHQICSDIFNSLEFPKFSSDSDGSSKARMNIEDKISQAVDVENLINSVKCKKLPNFVQGFTSKFYALLYTTFSDVLFMDADNVAANNVNIIFDSHEYKSTGSILWPDLWGDKCRFDKKNKHPGESSYENHVLFVANFGGLKWQNIRKYAQEAETGQMAFDLTRHRGLLDFGRKFIEDTQFLKKTVNGDKDIFRFMHLISGEPFHFIPHFPGYSFNNHERDCLVHFFGPASSSSSSLISSSSTSFSTSSLSTSSNSSFSGINDNYISHAIYSDESLNSENYEVPMFFHQLKIRNPNAFQQILRIPPNYRNSPSGCLPLGILPDTEESIQNEKDVVKEEQIKRKNGRFQRKSHRKLMKTRLRNNIGSKKISIDDNYVLKNSSSIVLSIPIIKSEEIEIDNFPDLIIDKKLLGFESIKRKKNAEKLFKEVDINWQKMNCNRLLWWHNLSIKNSLYPYMPWFLKKKNNGLF